MLLADRQRFSVMHLVEHDERVSTVVIKSQGGLCSAVAAALA